MHPAANVPLHTSRLTLTPFTLHTSHATLHTSTGEMMLKDSVPILTELESERLINEDDIKRQAVHLVEQVIKAIRQLGSQAIG